jgi:FkbM family methyltransferase
MGRRRYFRFLWSHESGAHRSAVKVYNRIMRRLPYGLKYGVGMRLRRGSDPYRFVREGSVVVQVGAPKDLMESGRSRAIYFSLFAGRTGRVVVAEPDPESARMLTTLAERFGWTNLTVVPTALWNEPGMLKIYIDDSHPASNFIAGVKEYDAPRLGAYRLVEVPAETLDGLLERLGVERVDLVSLTTNGSEREILGGMTRTIAAGVPYIAIAETGSVSPEVMTELGYEQAAFDDRGRTFRQSRSRTAV